MKNYNKEFVIKWVYEVIKDYIIQYEKDIIPAGYQWRHAESRTDQTQQTSKMNTVFSLFAVFTLFKLFFLYFLTILPRFLFLYKY